MLHLNNITQGCWPCVSCLYHIIKREWRRIQSSAFIYYNFFAGFIIVLHFVWWKCFDSANNSGGKKCFVPAADSVRQNSYCDSESYRIPCPVRDKILVENEITPHPTVPSGTECDCHSIGLKIYLFSLTGQLGILSYTPIFLFRVLWKKDYLCKVNDD